MKNLFFILILISINTLSIAQNNQLENALRFYKKGELDKAKTEIDNAVTDKGNENNPEFWLVRGQIYHTIFESNDIKYRTLHNNPSSEALMSYLKALDLDKVKKFNSEILNRLTILTSQFVHRGVDYYNMLQFDKALICFENAIKVNTLPQFNRIDTMTIYNAGLAAEKSRNFTKAKIYYGIATKLNYGKTDTYILLTNIYKAENDSQGVINTLKEGISKYPKENNQLIVELVNYYITSGNDAEALKFIKVAINKEPNNATYQYALGTLYDKTGKNNEAMSAYKKAIEINSSFFEASYNLGAIYFNKGVQIAKSANEVNGPNYLKLKQDADDQFKLSLPYLEKALEIRSKDIPTMKSLKVIYDRLKMSDKLNQIKLKLGEK